MNIAYYVSGHGFGHISRSYEIIKFLSENKPVDTIFINTTRKEFVKEKKAGLVFRYINTDVGMVQLSSISLDLDKTLEAIFEFEKSKQDLIESEIEFLQKEKIDCIISDSSSLPFLLGKKLQLPSYFIGNFTWDFIYDNYAKENSYYEKYSKTLKQEYALCKLGFILPFHCPVNVIPNKSFVGIIGRRSTLEREGLRKSIGFENENKYFLFSFGAYGIYDEFIFDNLKENEWIVISGYEDLKNKKVIDVKNIDYPDLVKACDYVLTKPGYGILSETYLAGTPVIYTDRGDFAEYEYLVQALKTYHLSAYISKNDLLAFNLSNAVSQIEKQRNIKRIPFLQDGRKDILQQIF